MNTRSFFLSEARFIPKMEVLIVLHCWGGSLRNTRLSTARFSQMEHGICLLCQVDRAV